MIYAITVVTIIATRVISRDKTFFRKRAFVYLVVFILLSGIAAYQHFDRSVKVLAWDYQAERIEDEAGLSSEVSLRIYRPFGDNNRLKTLDDAAVISFDGDYPKLDGATAAYPVYAAMAQALYKGLDKNTIENYVKCTKTDEAYERLTKGEIDIFFGAQPSAQQISAAQANGVEFVLTPIAKEAFVFFVSKDNPVDDLTIGEIQDIYQRSIVNWRVLGGNNERILPFQRPENSGSQTIMLAMVMKEKTLPTPLWEEYATGMGGMISQVAQYRNYSSAIGYSFRFYATGMNPNENIKLLAIDGVEPSIENIRNGVYPFTIDVYIVTTGAVSENSEKLIQWVLSEQGQSLIETCGYVSYMQG